MNRSKFLCGSVLLVIATLPLGARMPHATPPVSPGTTPSLSMPLRRHRQSVKDVLRERNWISTRGTSAATSSRTPERAPLNSSRIATVPSSIEAVSDNSTRVALDARKQTYRRDLLTYPGWRPQDRGNRRAEALLEAIQARATLLPRIADSAGSALKQALLRPSARCPPPALKPEFQGAICRIYRRMVYSVHL